MSKLKTLLYASLFVLLACLSNVALADPESGWWWNPNEAGRGFFVESHDGIIFIGGYFYSADGHATWLVAGGASGDPYNYTGPLYSELNGQTLFGSYVAPSGPATVGTLSAHFSDDTHGTLIWPGGTIAIERYVFGGTDGTLFMPATGWYWNADESGSGYSIELQGKNLFIVGYMYDDSGQPVWYLSAGPMSSAKTYSGPLLQFANGQTMTGPYHPPGAPATVATLNLDFTAIDEADITFTETSAVVNGVHAMAGGRSRSDHLKKTFWNPFIFPDSFSGLAVLTSTVTNNGLSVKFSINTLDLKLLKGTWDPVLEVQPYFASPGTSSQLSKLSINVSGDTPGCTTSGNNSFDLTSDMFQLYISEGGSYQITFSIPLLVVPATISCPPAPDVNLFFTFAGLQWPITGLTIQNRLPNGMTSYGAFSGSKQTVPAPGAVVTGDWVFTSP